MATKAPKKKPKATAFAPGAALLRLRPREFDREIVAAVIGERSVTSMPQVGREFGVSAHTVRQGWKSSGMPGGNGDYPLVDIALWKLEHDRKNEKYTSPQNRLGDEMKEIELRKAKAQLDAIERKAAAEVGHLVSLDQVRREIKPLLAVLSKTLLDIPRALSPLLPEKIASAVVAECEKLIRHALTAFTEKTYRQFFKEAEEEEGAH